MTIDETGITEQKYNANQEAKKKALQPEVRRVNRLGIYTFSAGVVALSGATLAFFGDMGYQSRIERQINTLQTTPIEVPPEVAKAYDLEAKLQQPIPLGEIQTDHVTQAQHLHLTLNDLRNSDTYAQDWSLYEQRHEERDNKVQALQQKLDDIQWRVWQKPYRTMNTSIALAALSAIGCGIGFKQIVAGGRRIDAIKKHYHEQLISNKKTKGEQA